MSFRCFPSPAIWPTYCILLSTFCSVLSNLSAFHLSIDYRNLWKFQDFRWDSSLFPISSILSPILLVEMRGLEPLAYALQRHRSPSWATSPNLQMNNEWWIIFFLNSFLWISSGNRFFLPVFLIIHFSLFTIHFRVGLSGLEPETSPLSEARSNQLS